MREAREHGGVHTGEGSRGREGRWREWRCFYCGKKARWRTSEGKPLCDFAAKAWVECYPFIPVRMTREANEQSDADPLGGRQREAAE
jgi:hypothetical protein